MFIGIQNGEKQECTICSVIVRIGVFHDNELGECLFLSFMEKMVHLSLQMKQLLMSQPYFWSMAQIFGLKGMQKTFSQMGLYQNIVQMVPLQKKQTLWMFGLIQVLHMKRFLPRMTMSAKLMSI